MFSYDMLKKASVLEDIEKEGKIFLRTYFPLLTVLATPIFPEIKINIVSLQEAYVEPSGTSMMEP